MVRTRTSASGDHEPIPTLASRGRGTGRGRGRGRGRIVAHVESQVPIATKGHDRAVPPDADVIHGDGMVQAGTLSITFDAPPTRVRGQTPDLMVAPDSQIPRTQPTANVASCLDGMELQGIASHLANRPSMTIDEQKMFGRHALMILPIEAERVRRFVKGLVIPIHLGVSQVVASGVAFQKVVDAAKDLETIRCVEFEKREGKKADHSGDYGGAPPKS
uniref:Uncharacterized protein n=1 Tax=Solanum tuberosum TaxID=4113 RepID=M1DPT0_SOLTU